ncbi:hypothetical protein ABZU45_34980 [Streptomyces avermitilis]|uniref:hypothetical protein n=1 Tax=Streptomyces avermitilis TaxID=33903 RepID=UPI0033B07CED
MRELEDARGDLVDAQPRYARDDVAGIQGREQPCGDPARGAGPHHEPVAAINDAGQVPGYGAQRDGVADDLQGQVISCGVHDGGGQEGLEVQLAVLGVVEPGASCGIAAYVAAVETEQVCARGAYGTVVDMG